MVNPCRPIRAGCGALHRGGSFFGFGGDYHTRDAAGGGYGSMNLPEMLVGIKVGRREQSWPWSFESTRFQSLIVKKGYTVLPKQGQVTVLST